MSFAVSKYYFSALQSDKILAVESMLKSNPNLISDYDFDGNTGLHWACAKGNLWLLQQMLLRRPNLEMENRRGQTALCIAIFGKKLELAMCLLAHGASPFIFAKNMLNPVDNDSCLAAARYMLKAYAAAAFLPGSKGRQSISAARAMMRDYTPSQLEQYLAEKNAFVFEFDLV